MGPRANIIHILVVIVISFIGYADNLCTKYIRRFDLIFVLSSCPIVLYSTLYISLPVDSEKEFDYT